MKLQAVDIILPNLAIGGAEKVMLLIARELKSKNYTVRFVVRQLTEEGFQVQIKKDFEIINLNTSKVRGFPAALKEVYKQIDSPDVILVSLWPLTFLTVITFKFITKKTKVICIEHGSLTYQTRNKGYGFKLFLKISLWLTTKLAHRMVCVSEGLLLEIQKATGYKGKKLISIPNSVQIKESEIVAKTELTKLYPGHIFLSVGRLKRVKNIPLLLKAFKKVTDQIVATLLIVGDGPEAQNLKILAKEIGINNHVHFLGFQNNCHPYYNLADTFVLSSDSEGFGNVIVEALAQGCTVVSTDCPYGPREILENGKYGYLCNVNDVDSLGIAMMQASKAPFKSVCLKKRAEAFTPEKIVERYISLFS